MSKSDAEIVALFRECERAAAGVETLRVLVHGHLTDDVAVHGVPAEQREEAQARLAAARQAHIAARVALVDATEEGDA